MISRRLSADWWRVLLARVLIGLWGLAVAFGLDAFAHLSEARRGVLGMGLAALLAGGIGVVHWGATPSLGLLVLAGGAAVALVAGAARSPADHCKRG